MSEAGEGGDSERGSGLVLQCSATSLVATVLGSFRCCFRRELFFFSFIRVCIDTPAKLWPELNCVLCCCLRAHPSLDSDFSGVDCSKALFLPPFFSYSTTKASHFVCALFDSFWFLGWSGKCGHLHEYLSPGVYLKVGSV